MPSSDTPVATRVLEWCCRACGAGVGLRGRLRALSAGVHCMLHGPKGGCCRGTAPFRADSPTTRQLRAEEAAPPALWGELVFEGVSSAARSWTLTAAAAATVRTPPPRAIAKAGSCCESTWATYGHDGGPTLQRLPHCGSVRSVRECWEQMAGNRVQITAWWDLGGGWKRCTAGPQCEEQLIRGWCSRTGWTGSHSG